MYIVEVKEGNITIEVPFKLKKQALSFADRVNKEQEEKCKIRKEG